MTTSNQFSKSRRLTNTTVAFHLLDSGKSSEKEKVEDESQAFQVCSKLKEVYYNPQQTITNHHRA